MEPGLASECSQCCSLEDLAVLDSSELGFYEAVIVAVGVVSTLSKDSD